MLSHRRQTKLVSCGNILLLNRAAKTFFLCVFIFVAELLRQYLLQIRQETGNRIIEKVFATEDGKPNKWWMCFAKKRFMEKSLSGPGQ